MVEDEETATEQAGQLIGKARSELSDEALKQNVVELIETIMVYKLPTLSGVIGDWVERRTDSRGIRVGYRDGNAGRLGARG